MNKQDYEKACEISENPYPYGIPFDDKSINGENTNKETLIRLQRYNAAMLMAQWKEQQMIEKVADWLEENIPSSDLERRIYNCFSEEQKSNLIERFKKEIKEE